MRGDERERIADSLVALPQRPGYPLLKGDAPAGETARRADLFNGLVRELWLIFDAYERALDDGREALELADERARPTLLGPAVLRLSLDEAVARMTRLYAEATELLDEAQRDWEQCVARVERAEAALAEAGRHDLEDRELTGLRARLADVRAAVRVDPVTAPNGLGALVTALEAASARLAEAARARRDHHPRTEALRRSLARLTDQAVELGELRSTVEVKIADPPATAVPDPASFAELIVGLPPLGAEGRWTELAAALDSAESRIAAALAATAHDRDLLQGLLDRRSELRGRFDAYSAKASRLGILEDQEVNRHRATVRALLWTSPCDLRQATVALAAFSKALSPEAAP